MLGCVLLLVACTNRVGGVSSAGTSSTPRGDALTAAAAFGDLRTIDYCTLLDDVGEPLLSSFELCTTEVDLIERTVGPLSSGDHVDGVPREDPEDLPAGVRVRARTAETGCVLWVGFADDVWLAVAVADGSEPPWSVSDVYCGLADHVVSGVLDAIGNDRVGHLTYGPGSFGALDPCQVIGGPEFAAAGRPVGGPSGHDCGNGRVRLSFSVGWRAGDTPATVGGREATVRRDAPACHVIFQRPLPGEPRFMEQATVTVPGDSEEACTRARGAAELIAPKLP